MRDGEGMRDEGGGMNEKTDAFLFSSLRPYPSSLKSSLTPHPFSSSLPPIGLLVCFDSQTRRLAPAKIPRALKSFEAQASAQV
jgi:hypothetical protein